MYTKNHQKQVVACAKRSRTRCTNNRRVSQQSCAQSCMYITGLVVIGPHLLPKRGQRRCSVVNGRMTSIVAAEFSDSPGNRVLDIHRQYCRQLTASCVSA